MIGFVFYKLLEGEIKVVGYGICLAVIPVGLSCARRVHKRIVVAEPAEGVIDEVCVLFRRFNLAEFCVGRGEVVTCVEVFRIFRQDILGSNDLIFVECLTVVRKGA